jgi:hypothetical protein
MEVEITRQHDTWALRSRTAASVSAVDAVGAHGQSLSTSTSRSLGFVDLALLRAWRGTSAGLTANLAGDETAGSSFGQSFSRTTARAGFATRGTSVPNVTGSVSYGAVSRGASPFEQFSIGGGVSPLLAREVTTQWVAMPALPKGVASGQSVFTYRATLDVPPLAWYLWSASTADLGERFSVWHRVLGIELTQSIARIPLAGTPAARVQVGVGRSLDEPYRHQTRAYLSIVLNP